MTNALQRAAAFVLCSYEDDDDYCPEPKLPELERDRLEEQLHRLRYSDFEDAVVTAKN